MLSVVAQMYGIGKGWLETPRRVMGMGSHVKGRDLVVVKEDEEETMDTRGQLIVEENGNFQLTGYIENK